jgi:hypothetical protein
MPSACWVHWLRLKQYRTKGALRAISVELLSAAADEFSVGRVDESTKSGEPGWSNLIVRVKKQDPLTLG